MCNSSAYGLNELVQKMCNSSAYGLNELVQKMCNSSIWTQWVSAKDM